MSIFDSIKSLIEGNVKRAPCSKCGKLITLSKSSIVLEAKEYGYCPVCKKLYCKKCATTALLSDEEVMLECLVCSVKLKGNL